MTVYCEMNLRVLVHFSISKVVLASSREQFFTYFIKATNTQTIFSAGFNFFNPSHFPIKSYNYFSLEDKANWRNKTISSFVIKVK